ncbi:MAG: hypothetical protein COA44_12975 [Arcobacter sp.]|nr:MAG: hypothetical protein COA44_12975 [Arcobacter sp.]
MPNNILSLLLFDIDYDDSMPSHYKLDTPQEVRESLIKLYPVLECVAMLIRPSSSAGIYNSVTEKKRSKHNSWHIYIVVANSTTETNKVFLEFTKRRAWRSDVNLAYAKVTGAGVVERYYTDLAVQNDASRLIVEPSPILEYPLVKESIPSVLFEGGALDLASIDYTLEPDYRDTYAQEKIKLMATVPAIASNPKKGTTTKTTLAATSNEEGSIFISEKAKTKVMDIYSYLKNTSKPEVKDVKKFLNDEVTSALITHLGYSVDSNYKFKLRAENTPSCSINHNGYIKDFGSEFAGSIIDFIMHAFDTNFRTSWFYLRACFDSTMPPLPINVQGVLPEPTKFEQRLKIKNHIGLI